MSSKNAKKNGNHEIWKTKPSCLSAFVCVSAAVEILYNALYMYVHLEF